MKFRSNAFVPRTGFVSFHGLELCKMDPAEILRDGLVAHRDEPLDRFSSRDVSATSISSASSCRVGDALNLLSEPRVVRRRKNRQRGRLRSDPAGAESDGDDAIR
jgi:hypothetical protein